VAIVSTGDSETESDAGTDDEQFYEEDDVIYDLVSIDNTVQSTEEFLLARRARIERMLKIYQAQHARLKQTLQAKYQQFIKQRQQATNTILATKGTENQHASVKLRMKMVDHRHDDEIDPEQLNLQHLLEGVASFPPENHQVYQCNKEDKFDDVTGEPLCSHPMCHARRMMCSDFCFEHILFDEKQRLYMAGPNGVNDPVLCYRMANTIASAFAVQNEKKVVVIEKADYTASERPVTESEEKKFAQALQKLKE
jgi:hypothetical protein